MSTSLPVPDPGQAPAYECDTPEQGELDLNTLLLPDGKLPTAGRMFSLSYSTPLLQGWVAQPSPCCAAASVAGAFNALQQYDKTDSRALDHLAVMEIYRQAWDGAVAMKKASFERKLGAGSIDPVIEAVERQLAERGESLMSKGLTCTVAMRLVATAVASARRSTTPVPPTLASPPISQPGSQEVAPSVLLPPPPPPSTTRLGDGRCQQAGKDSTDGQSARGPMEGDAGQQVVSMPSNVWEALAELFGTSKDPTTTPEPMSTPTGASEGTIEGGGDVKAATRAATPVEAEDEQEGTDAEEEDEKVGGKEAGVGTKGVAGGWRWKSELHAFLKLIGSRQKLYKDKPSTGPIGNAALMRAVASLSEAHGCHVRAQCFMGKRIKGSKTHVQLSSKDSPAAIEEQWAALRDKFLQKDTVLLYHLKNHYALIFAIREWDEEVQDPPPTISLAAPPDQQTCVDANESVAETGTKVPLSGGGQPSRLVRRRQVLTARRAQRPSAWIDFDEVLLMSLKSDQSPERPVKDGPSPSANRSPGKTEAKEASSDLLNRIQGFMNPDLARLTSSPLRHVLEEKVTTFLFDAATANFGGLHMDGSRKTSKAKLRDGVRRAQEPYHKVDPTPRLASASGEPSGKPQSNVDSVNGVLHPTAVAPVTKDSAQGTTAV